MSTVTTERPTRTAPPTSAARPAQSHRPAPAAPATHVGDVDRDGLEVYCAEAQAWGRTRDLFCEYCGATDHDLR